MKHCMSVAVLPAVIALLVNSASAALLTFEEFLHLDETPIGTFYNGITFSGSSTGSDWVARDATSNNYNMSSYPSGTQYLTGEYWVNGLVGASTALDSTGDNGIISFDNQDATYLELNYTSGTQLDLRAYDASGDLLGEDSGEANRRFMEDNSSGPGTLRVDWESWDRTSRISYAVVEGSGDLWLIDNVSTDATGIAIGAPTVPLPLAVPQALVLVSLLGGFAAWRRR